MFVKLFGKCREDLISILGTYKDGDTIPSISEFVESIKLLRTIGYLSNFRLWVNGNWYVSYTYNDLYYIELEKENIDTTTPSKLNLTVNGGNTQLNYASDSSIINATQNNGIDMEQLNGLIVNIKASITDDLSQDDKESINESIEVIENEMAQIKPKRSLIKTALTTMSAIKGTAEVVSNNLCKPPLSGKIKTMMEVKTYGKERKQ